MGKKIIVTTDSLALPEIRIESDEVQGNTDAAATETNSKTETGSAEAVRGELEDEKNARKPSITYDSLAIPEIHI